MTVGELIENLKKENPKNEVWVESQDGTNALDVYEITEGRCGDGETFTIIITEQSVSAGDYISPIK